MLIYQVNFAFSLIIPSFASLLDIKTLPLLRLIFSSSGSQTDKKVKSIQNGLLLF